MGLGLASSPEHGCTQGHPHVRTLANAPPTGLALQQAPRSPHALWGAGVTAQFEGKAGENIHTSLLTHLCLEDSIQFSESGREAKGNTEERAPSKRHEKSTW